MPAQNAARAFNFGESGAAAPQPGGPVAHRAPAAPFEVAQGRSEVAQGQIPGLASVLPPEVAPLETHWSCILYYDLFDADAMREWERHVEPHKEHRMPSSDPFRDPPPTVERTPLVAALVLLGIYVMMYLSVAAALHMLEPANASTIESSGATSGGGACCPDRRRERRHAVRPTGRVGFATPRRRDASRLPARRTVRHAMLYRLTAAAPPARAGFAPAWLRAWASARDAVRAFLARRRRRREAAAFRDELRALPDAVLRDLGFDRSEIGSVAAEAAGAVEATRARAWLMSQP